MANSENLSDKIAVVLRNGKASSEDLRSLLASSEKELARLQKLHAEKREVALDPLLSTADIREIRQVTEDAAFEVDRLNVARERLEARLRETVSAERRQERHKRYNAAVAQRDTLARRIAEEYPPIQKALFSLITEIVSVSAEISAVNADLPEGAAAIEKPEGYARGFKQATRDTARSYPPPLIAEMMVPIFDDARKVAWPPSWKGHDLDTRQTIQDIERFAGRVVQLRENSADDPAASGTEAA